MITFDTNELNKRVERASQRYYETDDAFGEIEQIIMNVRDEEEDVDLEIKIAYGYDDFHFYATVEAKPKDLINPDFFEGMMYVEIGRGGVDR